MQKEDIERLEGVDPKAFKQMRKNMKMAFNMNDANFFLGAALATEIFGEVKLRKMLESGDAWIVQDDEHGYCVGIAMKNKKKRSERQVVEKISQRRTKK